MSKKDIIEINKYEEAIKNLEAQRTQYLQEVNKNQTLALKAEGALEVLKQLEQGIEDDTKSTD